MKKFKIFNFKFQIGDRNFSQTGFTLVEILVTIVIIGVIGYMLSDILVRSLNNGQKSQVLGNIKQNAQTALFSMSQTIRNASLVVCNSGDILGLQDKNGNYTRFRFYPPPSVTTNGYITQDFPTVVNPANATTLCAIYTPTNEVTLTDLNSVSGVSIVNGQFTIVQIPGSKDNVTIHFEVTTGAQSANGFQNQLISNIPYETTIQLR